jgi:hypothetical protein
MNKITAMINLLILLFSFSSCNDWQNRPGVSENIDESKKRGVFICEYQANPNPIKINDSLIFDVHHAWLEKKWRYLESFDETDLLDGYQLIIETNNEIPKNLGRAWTIGVDVKRYVRLCGKKCLITDFENLPVSGREVWKVQSGRNLNEGEDKTIIGEFILHKRTKD